MSAYGRKRTIRLVLDQALTGSRTTLLGWVRSTQTKTNPATMGRGSTLVCCQPLRGRAMGHHNSDATSKKIFSVILRFMDLPHVCLVQLSAAWKDARIRGFPSPSFGGFGFIGFSYSSPVKIHLLMHCGPATRHNETRRSGANGNPHHVIRLAAFGRVVRRP